MRVALGILGIGLVAGSTLFVACGGGDSENLFNAAGTAGAAGSTGGSGHGGSSQGGSSGQGGTAKGGSSGQGGTTNGGASGQGGGAGNGGTSGTGGVGGASGGGSGGTAGTGGSGGADACAVQSLPVERVESETYLVFDRSGSMSDGAGGGTKWTELRTALNAFFAEPESAPLIFGVTPLPPVDNNTDQCDPLMYEKPPVIPGILGQGKASEIASYLQPLIPDGTSPWSAAFTGAIEYAKSRATANPARNVTVLLAGDAPATDCDVAMANIQAILAAGQSGTPSIRMYVIGLLVGGVSQDVTDMNSLASASGTFPPWLPNPPVSSNIVSALREYRDRVACDVTLPLVQGAPPDPAKTMLEVQTGSATVLSHVADAASCAGNTWYNVDSLRGRLCPQVCKTVLASASAKMVIKTTCP